MRCGRLFNDLLLAAKQQSDKHGFEGPERNRNKTGARARERTTAVRDDLIVWGERCAWADLAAVGCEGWVSVLFLSALGLSNVG
jgi:hypothetical protein